MAETETATARIAVRPSTITLLASMKLNFRETHEDVILRLVAMVSPRKEGRS